ncbi:MAG TPA: hypothetical protein VHA73_01350 [Acidimicrobiales bacterium]|nr:hypothetical protein [Acidimicrobiales bacterium]
MLGGLLLIIVLVVVIPPLVIITGCLVAAALGFTLKDDGEVRNEGSELLDLNI